MNNKKTKNYYIFISFFSIYGLFFFLTFLISCSDPFEDVNHTIKDYNVASTANLLQADPEPGSYPLGMFTTRSYSSVSFDSDYIGYSPDSADNSGHVVIRYTLDGTDPDEFSDIIEPHVTIIIGTGLGTFDLKTRVYYWGIASIVQTFTYVIE